MAATEAKVDKRRLPPVEENVDGPDTASQSLLAKIDNCPRSGYLSLKYRDAPQSHAMARGTAHHIFAEQATRTMIEQGEPAMPGDVCRELQQSIIDEHPELPLRAEDRDVLRLLAWNWGEATFLELDTIAGVEMMLTMEINGWVHRGKVDRIEVRPGRVDVYDYKSSLHVPSQEEAERDWQLLDYGLLAAEGTDDDHPFGITEGINDFWLHLVFPRYRKEDTGELVERIVPLTRNRLREFREDVGAALAVLDHGLETAEWPAVAGSWCSQCPCQPECPLPEHLREIEQIESDADARALAERIEQGDRDLRRLRKTAKAWATDNGAVFFGDYALDFTKSESRSVKDREALQQAIDTAAKTGTPFNLDDFMPLKVSTRFARRKQTPEERGDDDGS